MADQILTIIHDLISLLRIRDVILGMIFICSIIAVTIFLERLWNLRISKICPRKFFESIQRFIGDGKLLEAKILCQQNQSPLARVLSVSLDTKPETELDYLRLRENLDEVGRQEAFYLEGPSDFLNAISNVAVLLGLFGTVVGMVEIFDVIAIEGAGRGSVLSKGIATALVNTILGLAVAIPSLVAYKYCMYKVRSLVADLERCTTVIMDQLVHQKVLSKS